ncbi:MAG TPA: YdcF family protein [Candidatus Angelobacter sp.]|nr:YdcF family protein [Candidatus Angelobacter sp.]
MTKWLLVLIAIVAGCCFFVAHSASVLVTNNPVKSDVILVVAGDWDSSRFHHALKLLEAGYGSLLIMDVQGPVSHFGVSDTDLARAFVASRAPGRARVCEVFGESTFSETADVARCLQPLRISSVLIVTSDYHTRRALAIFKKRLPQYQWSVAASDAPLEPNQLWERSGDQWWMNRRWAKTVLDEWQKWIWWFVVDRWRAQPALAG